MSGTWRCRECGNLNPGSAAECLDCRSEEWAEGSRIPVGRRYSLTKEAWETVQLAPLWTFKLVSEIDGRLDRQEREALTAALNNAQRFDSFLLREACGAVARDLQGAIARHEADPRGLEEAFCDVGRVVDEVLSPSEAEGFKRDLISLGMTIARASGGGVFGGADRMSEIEARALCFMASVLGTDPPPPGPGQPCPRTI